MRHIPLSGLAGTRLLSVSLVCGRDCVLYSLSGIALSLFLAVVVLFCCAGNEYKKGVDTGRIDSQMAAYTALSHCKRAKKANRMLKESAIQGEQGDPFVVSDDWHRMRKVET